ncbi:FG-GAP-like repeat-containing protein [Sediminibacterium goheungense]|uniref:VCBS repeat protein n=1 Tax=Sediminibacterium goheungense TaxID=1086393 RepID=A0A4R6IYS6_9BACT|nr:FG-GAP-like repeat-containing protein [Sediminibacterium goheungense]TDO27025.1 VCBS repeat protein [Sediminibacterium goheungense]
MNNGNKVATIIFRIGSIFLFLTFTFLAGAQPVISSFTPALGKTGSAGTTLVTINGSGFSTTPANNIIFFGAVSVAATTASATQLTVNAPAGATSEYLSVVNLETGLKGSNYSQNPFIPTFYNEGSMSISSSASFSYSAAMRAPYFRMMDMDGDAKPDIVFVSSSSTISILRNTSGIGTVNFDAGNVYTAIDFGVGYTILAFDLSDMNGDAKPDIVAYVRTSGTTDQLTVVPNLSTSGTFIMGTPFDNSIATRSTIYTLRLVDMDGDGKPDILFSPNNELTTKLVIWRNLYTTGAGFSFDISEHNSPTGSSSRALKIIDADFNGDNLVDIGVSFVSAGTINSAMFRIFYNSSTPGSISFSGNAGIFTLGTTSNTAFTAGFYYYANALDLDGDNKPDVASANYGGNNIATLLNLGTQGIGNLATRVGVSLGGGSLPGSLAFGDVDGDGKIDLTATGSGNIYIQRNNSTLSSIAVAGRIVVPALSSPLYHEICDIDLDGLPDFIVTNASVIAVFTNNKKNALFLSPRFPF